MPALYRMPVFYVLVLVGVLGYSIHHALRPPSEVVLPLYVADEPIKIAPSVAEEETKARGDGILRTPEGLRRKVVVKDLAVVCRTEPEGGRPVGAPLDYFAIRYLYGDKRNDFQVGPKDGPAQGWVPAASVLEWDTRLMARPTPRSGRPPLVIYRDESCLAHAVNKTRCPRHPERCPTEGEEPTEPATTGRREDTPLGLPILSTKVVDGQTFLEVASLVKDRAQVPILPAEPPADLRPYLRVINVAFVIDSTASMESTIEAARKLAAEIVRSASRTYADVTLKFALVEYRDAAPLYGFKARKVTSFTGPSGFLIALRRLSAAAAGDGSVDESVLDGLTLALPPLDGEKASDHVDWPTGRAGELATKLIVLLGDAPDHDRNLDRSRALADRARQSRITIATVALDKPGTLSADEKSRYRDQWRTLAEASYRPLDRESGFARPVLPLMVTLTEGRKLVDRLRGLIDDRVESARSIAAIAVAEAEGRLGEYVNSQGLTLDRVAPVLVDLHRGDASRVARPDPRAEGRKAPSVRRGWLAERSGNKPMVSIEILMSAAELKTLIDELSQLQQAASGTSRDLSELLQIGTAAASGETSFLAADRGSRTFADHLRRRQGLPPARPDSLLSRSQSDLLRSDELTLAALDSKLRVSLAELTRRLLAPDWSDPRRTIDGMAWFLTTRSTFDLALVSKIQHRPA